MRSIILVAISVFVIANAGEKSGCYLYDPHEHNASVIIDYMQPDRPIDLEWFVIRFKKCGESDNTCGEAVAMAEGYGYEVGIYCKREENGTAYCGADCDHGNFLVDADHRLRINRLGLDGKIGCENYYADQEDILIIDGSGRWVKGVPVPCSRYRLRHFRTRPKPDDRKLYVCYASRTTSPPIRHSGCFRSNTPCSRIGRQNFGRYENFCAAAKAMQRCLGLEEK